MKGMPTNKAVIKVTGDTIFLLIDGSPRGKAKVNDKQAIVKMILDPFAYRAKGYNKLESIYEKLNNPEPKTCKYGFKTT